MSPLEENLSHSPGILDEIEKAGRERLHPALTDPNWLVLRKRRDIFSRWLHDLKLRDPRVLDVGGRIQPYRSLIEGRKTAKKKINGDDIGPTNSSRYIALDFVATPLVNVIANAHNLPFLSASFDLVCCTQMVEYANDPQRVIDEIHRVLKPGGFLLLSVPSVYPQDSVNDRWRFLPGALTILLAGFSKIEIAPEGSSVVGFVRTVNVCLLRSAAAIRLAPLVQYSLVPLLNLFGLGLEAMIATGDNSFAANFSVLAEK